MKSRMAVLLLLGILCLTLAVVPASAGTLYNNGPCNCDTDAWTINFGYVVSDSFQVANNSSIQDLHFVYWDASMTDVVTSVEMQLGTAAFEGNTYALTGATNTYLGTNSYGYAIFQADFTFGGIPWSGNGWMSLQNACTVSGCSVSNPIYWDENSGPSDAYDTGILGTIPSEAFTLTGSTGGGTTPEPGSIMLLASGICGLGAALRKKLL